MTSHPSPSPLPLSGIRVLDLSRILAGPWAAQTLADLGAEVIKVERPSSGDDTRAWGPPFLNDVHTGERADAAYFMTCNRGKQSITVDFTQEEGAQLLKTLVQKCDILIENFKVGGLKKYGLDYASLKEIHPGLIYCSITGFGQTGPYAERPGYDFLIQAMGGLMSITGERDDLGGGPQKVGVAVADLFTGMYATVGILAALRHADHTGQGQWVDMSLLDTQVAMLANLGANYLVSGKVPGRAGNAHQNIVPYQVFEVQSPLNAAPGAKDHLILAVGNDGQFAKFCTVAGHPEIAADPRYAKNSGRVSNREDLVPLLEAILKTRTKAEWLPALEAAKVPCGAINDLAEVVADPHVQARHMITSWNHPIEPNLRLMASPLKLSETPVRTDFPPPLLGQHTDEVLTQLLAYSAEQLAQMRWQGVI